MRQDEGPQRKAERDHGPATGHRSKGRLETKLGARVAGVKAHRCGVEKVQQDRTRPAPTSVVVAGRRVSETESGRRGARDQCRQAAQAGLVLASRSRSERDTDQASKRWVSTAVTSATRKLRWLELWAAAQNATDSWKHLRYGPFSAESELRNCVMELTACQDQPFWIARPVARYRAEGWLSLCDIYPADGAIEIGSIWFSPRMQKTRASTRWPRAFRCTRPPGHTSGRSRRQGRHRGR
jgi:hypothetical protein